MQTITSKEHSAMAKTSKSHSESSTAYNERNTVRIVMNVNKSTMDDVITALESVDSKQGYIVSLIRRDMARAFSNHLLLPSGADVCSTNAAKYADEIADHFDAFRKLSNQEALSRVESMFLPGTAPYIIVAEYLRSTETDPIIIT